MAQGRAPRIVGSITLLAAGVFSALTLVVQFVLTDRLMADSGVEASYSVIFGFVSILSVLGSILFVASYLFLAFARGAGGLFKTSRLPTVGFIVLAVFFALIQLFFRFGSFLVSTFGTDTVISANRAINVLLIAAIVFAAITIAARGTVAGFARVVLFLPAVVLSVIQYPFPLPYPVFLLPQAAYGAVWVIVAISYLIARPRENAVTVSSENLTE